MSVWTELRRRNVFKVGAAYVILAWLLIQIVSVIFPTLQLPQWTVTFVTAALITAFPVAIFLAWAYEITPSGVKRTKHVPLAESIRNITGQKLNYVVTGLLVAAVAFMAVDNYWLRRDTGNSELVPVADAPAPNPVTGASEPTVLPNSIAVLPFENLSPNPDNAYFAEGVHESVLNQLAKIEDLNVIARTTMLRYTAGDKGIPEIASELNVQTVMEGSVRYARDRVRVTAQLIDSRTGAHLWSEEYDRQLSDIFAIQSDIARRIAQALEVEFSLAEQARVEKPPTDSPEAYALYLKVIASVGGRFPPSAGGVTIEELIERAIELDPGFALAYALKAELLDAIDEAGALEAIQKALELDPNLGIAHAALADIHRINWRSREARLAFEHAVEVSPNDANVLRRYAIFDAITGRTQAALDLANAAMQLDPQNAGSYSALGWVNQFSGDREAAAAAAERGLEVDPANAELRLLLARIELSRGELADASEQLRLVAQLTPPGSLPQTRRFELAYCYRLAGLADEARAVLDEQSPDEVADTGSLIYYHLALAEYDEVLDALRIAVAERPPALLQPPSTIHIGANVWNDPVLEEPRFRALRAELRLGE